MARPTTTTDDTGSLSLGYAVLCVVDMVGLFPVIALPRAIINCEMSNGYRTVYRGDYLWPYIAPISFIPGPPAESWELRGPLPKSLVDLKLCQCDRHDWNPHFKRAKHLKAKEQAFREAMLAVAAERTVLENEILQHPCVKTEDALITMYSSDFSKKEFPVADYRSMKKDHDDPVVSPVPMPSDPQLSAYRDLSSFKTVALEPLQVSGPRPLVLTASSQSPLHQPDPYISEYMDTIAKAALGNLTSRERFKTLPSRDQKE